MTVFRLTMFPANEGDCLLLSYGQEAALRHVLIDGGRKATFKKGGLKAALEAIEARGEGLELLVLTHIDADHIEGLLELVNEAPPVLKPREVWFNGFDQMAFMPFLGILGIKQADAYTKALKAHDWPINARFQGSAIAVETVGTAIDIAGLKLTILSPDGAHLAPLRKDWEKYRREAEAIVVAEELDIPAAAFPLGPAILTADPDVEALAAPTPIDDAVPNGSSIAFLAEFAGKRVLLTGDAHPDVLLASLEGLGFSVQSKCPVDLFKLSHHGSKGNVTRELLDIVACHRFAVSTSGSRFDHPDPEAMARILKTPTAARKQIHFNYTSPETRLWDRASLQGTYGYDCVFPATGTSSVIDI
ncbi:ComEC/Rec2 family competence protein [Gimibacter soli]|uniref:MBL fold metallo-hydrolase n=1 Tax=Gimibacter soli TaxID=3024400 RepID=A0AAF0BGT9_9PROT|nr:MBL fold metallo-hydrolase [Gimibacter soli]WCL53863.1 MBL fold metallo-hydrolase [Gimibacter soli]